MANRELDLLGIDEDAFRAEVVRRAEETHALDELAERVRDTARGYTPIRTGQARAAWKVKKLTADGYPMRRVYNGYWKIHFIEFGTDHMPEYAPAAKTSAQFGGEPGTVNTG